MEGMLCNTGGPMSRRRTERLQASILGNQEGYVRCPSRRTVGIVYPKGADPITLVLGLCAQCGFSSGEEAREALRHLLPPEPLVAMPYEGPLPYWASEKFRKDQKLLVEALVLGLCTAHLYDPGRPVLWTGTSLSRRLELFSAGGFYAA